MRTHRNSLLIPFLIALSLLLTACGRGDGAETSGSGWTKAETEAKTAGAEDPSREAPPSETAEPGRETADGHPDGSVAENAGSYPGGSAAENAGGHPGGSTAEAVGGRYFKSGDFTYRLSVSPGTAENPNSPQLNFAKRDSNFSNAFSILHSFQLEAQAADGVYTLMDMAGGQAGGSFTVEWNRSGPIVLRGEMDEAGTYYPSDGNLIMPELFERPLNETDLIGLTPEDMKLMRNQFYAVYGREFKAEDLKTYFEGQPWYEGRLSADSFSEALLGGMEKRNIAFLKAAEESYDEAKARETKAAYEALPPAPYRGLLPERGEIWVELSSGSGHAADRGLYYEAEGTISVPITITRDQYQALAGKTELELVSNDLTGETAILKKAVNTDYGDYVLIDPQNPDEDYGTYVYFNYEPHSQTFSMWSNSADTVFKTVYEGSIYVLKGACEEYYNYFNLADSARPQGSGAYRVMEFNEADPYGPSPYMGNLLITDDKGYVKALYFMGD